MGAIGPLGRTFGLFSRETLLTYNESPCRCSGFQSLRGTAAARGITDISVAHLSDHDLERYYLGMVTDEAELASLEEHLLACAECMERAEETEEYVDAIRRAMLDRPID
jgi:hypothetical protein